MKSTKRSKLTPKPNLSCRNKLIDAITSQISISDALQEVANHSMQMDLKKILDETKKKIKN